MGKKQKTLEVYFTEEEAGFKWMSFETVFHEIRVKDLTVEKFLNSINRKNKDGAAVHSGEVKNAKMCFKIQQWSKPKKARMFGHDWEQSMQALLLKVFNEKWNPDDETPTPETSGVESVETGAV